jgi:hypothetical protein
MVFVHEEFIFFITHTIFFIMSNLTSPWFLIIINFINEFDLFDFTLVVAMDQINGKGLCVTCTKVVASKEKVESIILDHVFF